MQVKVFFTVNMLEDWFIICGETIQEIRSLTERELKKRNLDVADNEVWSIEVKD